MATFVVLKHPVTILVTDKTMAPPLFFLMCLDKQE